MNLNQNNEPTEAANESFEINATEKTGPSNFQILIAVVLVTSAAAIYGMRQIGVKSSGALQTAEIGVAAQAKGATPQEYKAAIAALEQSVKPVRPASILFNNDPFNTIVLADEDENDDSAERLAEREAQMRLAAEQEARERVARAERIDQAVASLNIQSVMGGRRPFANINGEIYSVGSEVNGEFVVESIEGRSVVLSAEGRRYELTMGGTEPKFLSDETDAGA